MQVQGDVEMQGSLVNTLPSGVGATVFGEKCNTIYEMMLRVLSDQKSPEAILRWVGVIAGFAESVHVGRYADGRLENPLFEIGRNLERILFDSEVHSAAAESQPRNSIRTRVLHVATRLYNVGGHTRLLKTWIQLDDIAEHSVVLTDQPTAEVPEWIAATVAKSGGVFVHLNARNSLLERARSLRRIAQSGYDALILHHHPSDVLPSVAFATADCPPVALMSHADHVFGLGPSAADVVLSVRGFGEEISKHRRFAKKNLLVPVPISAPDPSATRAEARSRLRIPRDKIVLLTVGSAYKFTPTETHNFFATTRKLLVQNPEAHLYAIGIHPNEFDLTPPHDRLHLAGVVEDPTIYRLAADIHLDSFPYGSLTALLESAALGVCPVLMYSPPAPQYDLSEDLGFSGLVACAESEEDYVAHVNKLIRHSQEREELGKKIRQSVLLHHCKNWKSYLETLYKYVRTNQHLPAPIPTAEFRQTKDDLALWEFKSALHRSTSLVKRTADINYDLLTLKDMIGLFRISLATRDNSFSFSEERYWLLMLLSKFLGRASKG